MYFSILYAFCILDKSRFLSTYSKKKKTLNNFINFELFGP